MDVDIFKIMSVLNPIIGVSVYGIVREQAVKKERAKQREIEQRRVASSAFKEITAKKEILEESLANLMAVEIEATTEYRQKMLSITITKYTALYNEIEEFCGQVLENAITGEKYIKGSVLNALSQYSEFQVEIYVKLKAYSEKFSLGGIRKPDIGAFVSYDEFLKINNGGENSHFWNNIKNIRRDGEFV